MNTNQSRDELFDHHLRGELTDVKKILVAELLDIDSAARQRFVEFAQWDTEIAETIREHAGSPQNKDILPSEKALVESLSSKKTFVSQFVTLLTVAVFLMLLSGLLYRQMTTFFAPIEKVVRSQIVDSPIATITGFSGSLLWTGNQGEIVPDLHIGRELTGGTIEGLAPCSWFELQFKDGSIVTISGTSMLTFADIGQKKLRLKQGAFTADVAPQPVGKPMIVQTPSTVIEVVGTRFEVEALQASTTVNVREGNVRLKHLFDGSVVDIPAHYCVTAKAGSDLSPTQLPTSKNHWKSSLNIQAGGFGKWIQPTRKRPGAQKALPFIPAKHPDITIALLGIPVSGRAGPPIVLTPNAQLRVRGRLHYPVKLKIGIAVSDENGEFAGMFRGDSFEKRPFTKIDEEKCFEVIYQLSDFSVDPSIRERKKEFAEKPYGLYLDRVWIFTNAGVSSRLMVQEVELVPGEIK